MSEHTLSGVDLTNGKRLNLKFTSGDLLGTGDLFDTTKIVEDIRKNKKEKEKSNTEKVDTFVEKVEKESPYEKLTDAYGGIEKLPTDLQPIKNVKSSLLIILNAIMGDPSSKRVVETQFEVKGLKDNEEIRIIPGTENDPKYFKVDKRAPGLRTIGRTFASIVDALSGQTLDLDKLGKKFRAGLVN